MIIHLFPKSGLVEIVINFFNSHFDSKEHLFVLYTNKPYELPKEIYAISNVRDYDQLSRRWLYRELLRSDRIIMHNLSVDIKELLLISHSYSIMRKITWVIWGGDLYWHRVPGKSLPDLYVDYLRGRVIRHMNAIAGLTDGDYQLAKEWYHSKAIGIRVNYCDIEMVARLDRIYEAGIGQKRSRVAVLVGNSATQSNHHFEVFDILKKFVGQPMDIYCPLSYGDMDYATEVEKCGLRLFGEHFIPIKDYMNLNEYHEFLMKMDIGIFNHDRQQALGNITGMAYLGKKLYLRKGTSMWQECQEKNGYSLFDISEIEDSSFETFCDNPEESIRKNRMSTSRYFDEDARVADWKYVFDMPLR